MSDEADKRVWMRSQPSYGPDWDAAIEFGIDISLIEANLALSPQERFEQLLAQARLAEELCAARRRLRGSED